MDKKNLFYYENLSNAEFEFQKARKENNVEARFLYLNKYIDYMKEAFRLQAQLIKK